MAQPVDISVVSKEEGELSDEDELTEKGSVDSQDSSQDVARGGKEIAQALKSKRTTSSRQHQKQQPRGPGAGWETGGGTSQGLDADGGFWAKLKFAGGKRFHRGPFHPGPRFPVQPLMEIPFQGQGFRFGRPRPGQIMPNHPNVGPNLRGLRPRPPYPPPSIGHMIQPQKWPNKRKRPRLVPPNEPPAEDVDYTNLLMQYRKIQRQLDDIKKEEEKAADDLQALEEAEAVADKDNAGESIDESALQLKHGVEKKNTDEKETENIAPEPEEISEDQLMDLCVSRIDVKTETEDEDDNEEKISDTKIPVVAVQDVPKSKPIVEGIAFIEFTKPEKVADIEGNDEIIPNSIIPVKKIKTESTSTVKKKVTSDSVDAVVDKPVADENSEVVLATELPTNQQVPSLDSKSEEGEVTDKDEDEDEDLDILQLRLEALASAARANKKALEQQIPTSTVTAAASTSSAASRNTRSSSRDSKSGRTSPRDVPKRRTRLDSHESRRLRELEQRRERRKRELQRRWEEEKRQKRKIEEERKKREEERRQKRKMEEELKKREERRKREEERKKREEEKKLEEERQRQRRECQMILTLDDHEEQVKRFIEFSRGGTTSARSNNKSRSRSPNIKRDRKKSHDEKKNADNYEEVEMDIDSDDSSKGELPKEMPLLGGYDPHYMYAQPPDLADPLLQVPDTGAPPYLPALSAAAPYLPQVYDTTGTMYSTDVASSFLPETSPCIIPGLDFIQDSNNVPVPEAMVPTTHGPLSELYSDNSLGPDSAITNEFNPLAVIDSSVISNPPPPPQEPMPPPPPPDMAPTPPPLPPEGAVEPEDDEEVAAMRQMLLASVVQKRLKSKLQEDVVHSDSSSPPPIEMPQPIPVTDALPVRKQASKKKIHKIPRQKPLVIQLGTADSSESDGEHERSQGSMGSLLDNFLKEARKEAEAKNTARQSPVPSGGNSPSPVNFSDRTNQNVPKQVRQVKVTRVVKQRSPEEQLVRDREIQLSKLRGLVAKDQQAITSVQAQVMKKKEVWKTARLKFQKLQEQLDAAQKIMNANTQALLKLNKQSKLLHQNFEKRRFEADRMAEDLQKMGKIVFGAAYVVPGGKMKMAQRATASPTPKSASLLAKEKERLLLLEQKYRQKIEEFKASQTKHAKTQMPNDIPAEAGLEYVEEEPQVETIITQEKMALDTAADPAEMVTIRPKRRRSLLDISNSTVPDLPRGEARNSPVPGKHKTKPGAEVTKNDSTNIKTGSPAVENTKPNSRLVIIKLQDGSELELDSHKSYGQVIQEYKPPNLCSAQAYSTLESFQPAVSVIPSLKVPATCDMSTEETEPGSLLAYQSPLLQLRSFRLSPYFRTKEGKSLSSVSFSHKIDPKMIFCRFDLMGTCNDDQCKWQHRRDYQMDETEILSDIVSYSPQVAGRAAATADAGELINTFTQTFSRRNSHLTSDQLNILMAGKVNDHQLKAMPHMCHTEKRSWKPSQPGKPKSSNNTPVTLPTAAKPKAGRSQKSVIRDLDDVLTDQDIRYWMLGSQELQDMESAVLDSPENIQLWIKLAYSKLSTQNSGTNALDRALNILARGLENNRSSPDLWQHYLKLYGRRGEVSNMEQLCQQAVHFAPTYDLWWQYLSAAFSVEKKIEVCKDIVRYLCDLRGVDPAWTSHCIVETTLHQVELLRQAGHEVNATKTLQSFLLKGEGRLSAGRLLQQDAALCWLCFLHLREFSCLPGCLFDPSNNNPGRLVSKEPFLFSWHQGQRTSRSYEELCAMFSLAIRNCSDKKKSVSENLEASLALHRNRILLDMAWDKISEAEKKWKTFVDEAPHLRDTWLVMADIVRAYNGSVSQVFTEAISSCPSKADLYYTAALAELQKGDQDAALCLLEDCSISFFSLDPGHKYCDPNLLYSKLLDVPVTLVSEMLPLKPGAVELAREQQVYLWMNYCLLLELQGDWDQAELMYDEALCALQKLEDHKQVWLLHLRRTASRLKHENNNGEDCQALWELMRRYLVAMPCKMPIQSTSSQHWLDYRTHQQAIDLYLSCVSPDHQVAACHKFLTMLPDSVLLIQRAIQVSMDNKDSDAAENWLSQAVCRIPACSALIDRLLQIYAQDRNSSQMQELLRRTILQLPYHRVYWIQLLQAELGCGNVENVQSIVTACEHIGIPITDVLKKLTNTEGR